MSEPRKLIQRLTDALENSRRVLTAMNGACAEYSRNQHHETFAREAFAIMDYPIHLDENNSAALIEADAYLAKPETLDLNEQPCGAPIQAQKPGVFEVALAGKKIIGFQLV